MGAPLPPRTRRTCEGRFRKGVLVPLWVVQLLVMFAVVGVEVSLWYVTGLQELSGGKGSSRYTIILFTSLAAFTAIITILEIALVAAHALKPLLYLFNQLAKLIIWLTLLGLWIASIAQSGDYETAAMAVKPATTEFILYLLVTVVPVLVFLAPLIYASVICHHYRCSRSQRRQRQRERMFSLEEGKYPEVSEKMLERNVWPIATSTTAGGGSEVNVTPLTPAFGGRSVFPYTSEPGSPTLVEGCGDAGVSPMSPAYRWQGRPFDHFRGKAGRKVSRQELGDEGWVKELDGDACDVEIEKMVHELGRESREIYELAAVRTPKRGSERTSGRRGSRKSSRGRMSGALSPLTRSRKSSRARLSEALSPLSRSRKGSRDELREVGRSRKGSRDELKEAVWGARGSRKFSIDELACMPRAARRGVRGDEDDEAISPLTVDGRSRRDELARWPTRRNTRVTRIEKRTMW